MNLNREPGKPIDLIHDDWFGLAPLASPESLSEVSSISSRTSFSTNLDKIQTLSASYELRTPKVMRRTPKIVGNLSTCADDARNVRIFQKMTATSKGLKVPSQNGSSSSNLSFESACSKDKKISGESDDFQSAEDILDNVIISAGCAEFFGTKTKYLETHFDDFLEEKPNETATSPQEVDPDVISNFAIDLNLDEEHRSFQFCSQNVNSSKTNSVDSGSVCRTPSEGKNVTFNPQVINIDPCYSCKFSPDASPCKKKSDRWHLLPGRSKSSKVKQQVFEVPKVTEVPKTILCTKRRSSEEFFSRTEALPLLSGLNASSERTSPNFVRRKKYVYPVDLLGKEETNV